MNSETERSKNMSDFESMRASLKSVRSTMVIMMIAAVAIGLIYIFSPVPAMEVVCYIIASAMCVYGVYSFVEYFVKSKTDAFGSFGLVRGVALVAFGIFIFLNPQFVSQMLASIVGIALILDGVVKAQYSVDLLRLKSERWWHLLIPAGVALILGIIVVFNPTQTAAAFMVFVGIALIVDALADLFSLIYLSMCLKQLEGKETALTKTEE